MLDALGYSYDVEQVPVALSSSNESYNGKLELRATATPAFPNCNSNYVHQQAYYRIPQRLFRVSDSIRCRFSLSDGSMGPALTYDFAIHQALTHSCLTSPSTPPYTGTNDIPMANGVLGSTNLETEPGRLFWSDHFGGHFGWKENTS